MQCEMGQYYPNDPVAMANIGALSVIAASDDFISKAIDNIDKLL